MARDPFDLSGDVALVTGASRGLGAAISACLARAGASVVLVGRTTRDLDDAARAISTAGGRAYAMQWDVRAADAADDLFERAKRAVGPVTILVNNAGIAHEEATADVDIESWRAVIDTNLTGTFATCRSFFRAGRSGAIVNVASFVAAVGARSLPAYVASKSAVVGLTRALALDGAALGIRVNAIAPGYFRTSMPGRVLDDPAARERLLRRIPVGRVAEPEEIGPPVLFLASRASAYMTGAVVYFDGGLTAQ